MPGRGEPPSLADLLGAIEVETAEGPCLLVERRFPLSYRHGGHELGETLRLSPRALALMARQHDAAGLDLRQALFLDTETTGLSGGTGTYAFLVGVGRFEHDAFVVRQFFMRDYGEELAMLRALDEHSTTARSLVTFNGRAFDWPLLETRYLVAARTRPRLRPSVHLDLLFPARRIWRGRFENCSLGTLEQAVLGHRRRGDVPGWLIPTLYFRFVREGDPRAMRQVFHHNLQDVLSLATLAARLGRLFDDPHGSLHGAEDLLAVARCYEDAGLADDAAGCYERALTLEPDLITRQTLLGRLAMLHKRRGRAETALALWHELAALGGDVAALVELAKHHEHLTRDISVAIDVVQQALTILELRALPRRSNGDGASRQELEHRLARLLRKSVASRLLAQERVPTASSFGVGN